MHTMTKRAGKSGTIDVKANLAEDEEFLGGLVRTALEEVLEAEMREALGAEKGERAARRQGYRSGYYGRTLIRRVGKLETGEQPAPSGVMVKSQIIKANGEPVKVDYMMRRNGEGWRISDIYLDGAVSEVATRGTECAFHIRDGRHWTAEYGIERKIELLRVAVVKSS